MKKSSEKSSEPSLTGYKYIIIGVCVFFVSLFSFIALQWCTFVYTKFPLEILYIASVIIMAIYANYYYYTKNKGDKYYLRLMFAILAASLVPMLLIVNYCFAGNEHYYSFASVEKQWIQKSTKYSLLKSIHDDSECELNDGVVFENFRKGDFIAVELRKGLLGWYILVDYDKLPARSFQNQNDYLQGIICKKEKRMIQAKIHFIRAANSGSPRYSSLAKKQFLNSMVPPIELLLVN